MNSTRLRGSGRRWIKVMLDASALAHSVGGDDDRGEVAAVDSLRLLRRDGKVEARPLQGRAVAGNQSLGLGAELLAVLEEDLHRVDSHRRVGKDRDARNLVLLHQFLEQEEKLLGALHGKGRHHDAAPALHGRIDQRGHLGHHVFVRMMAVSVGGLHHQHVRRLAFGGAGVYHLAGRDRAVAHAANVSGEEQSAACSVGG